LETFTRAVTNRIVEISNPCSLSVENRQLIIERDGALLGTVPVEDMSVLILDCHTIVYTQEVMKLCADSNIAVIWCNDKHLPSAMMVSFDAHNLHTKTLREQIAAKLPVKKRLWQQIVIAKIKEQAKCLRQMKKDDSSLVCLVSEVRSGDTTNVEGKAAQIYWQTLFGSDFTREREVPGINAYLNYGYAILRACTARAIVGTGLHPALGIHHKNQFNPFCLADDLVEPLRPLADRYALGAIKKFGSDSDLSPPVKRFLLLMTQEAVSIEGKQMPLQTGLQLYAAGVRKALGGLAEKLPIPNL